MSDTPNEQQTLQCEGEKQPGSVRTLRSCFSPTHESNWVLNLNHLQQWFEEQAGSIEVVNRSPVNMEALTYGLHQWAHDVTDVCRLPLMDSAMLVTSLFQMGFMAGFYSRKKEDETQPQ